VEPDYIKELERRSKLKYITVHVEMGRQTVIALEGETVTDEATAYRVALQHALLAVELLQTSKVASTEELGYYSQAGMPLLKLVLDHDKLCRRVLSDLNSTFKMFLRPLVMVVSVSV